VSETILVTGADGYVGTLVTARLLAATDARLVLVVRAEDRAELARKRAALALSHPARSARIEVVPADLRAPDPFAAVDPGRVTRILHAAAVTRFNVEQPLARAVNVDGAEKLVAFARRCPSLVQLCALSTVYSAGRRVGRVDETPHDGAAGFVNFYEWSKWEAERVWLAAAADLPVAILRIGTLIAEDDSGSVVQHNAFHNSFRLYYYGLLSLVPGEAHTPVYLLTGSLAAAAVAHLLMGDDACGIYHVCPDRSETATLGELIDAVLGVYERSEAYRVRRLLRPLFCDLEAFQSLAAGARALGSSPLGQAMASVSPFAAQLYLPKDVRNERLRRAFPCYSAPDPRDLVRATASSLVSTKWGRTPRKAA
jgi:nucleoside-diphosphate-sugar epimerase